MYKLVVFDLDGTLADTVNTIAACGNHALECIGLEGFDSSCYKEFAGDGVDELLRRMLIASGDNNCQQFDELKKQYTSIFKTDCAKGVTVFPHMKETLVTLRNHGIKLAVLSNKSDEASKTVIHDLFGNDLFDIVLGLKEGKKAKPDPNGVYTILEKLNVSKENVLYVGDTNTDVMTAINANITSVGVTWGFRSRKELEDNKACFIIDDPYQLLEICKVKESKKI